MMQKILFVFQQYRRLLVLLGLLTCLSVRAELAVNVVYLERVYTPPPLLSNLSLPPTDLGLRGAQLAISDNNTTGKFLKHDYSLDTVLIDEGSDWAAGAAQAIANADYILVNAKAEDVLIVTQLEGAANKLIFNVAAQEDALRNDQCVANLLHTIPSYSMRADALMQILSMKRWKNLFLVAGEDEQDTAFANAIRRATVKFRMNLEQDKVWAYNEDIRRAASQEVPLYTQGEYDVVLIADHLHDFGQYFLYNTWLPRPVAGDHGMRPVGFARSMEQWGAAQLHSRFEKIAQRPIQSIDYAAWAAVRSIGEAVTRTQSQQVGDIRQYIFSDDFELAGFKGQPLSFRRWSGQLRQPIGIVHTNATIALAPLDVFLHEYTPLDTLGFDRPETTCTLEFH